MQESHSHVGDLHSGIVDVVLDIPFPAGKTQQANKGVAEDGIAEVSDVRGLVRIDTRVLDQNLARWNVGLRSFISSKRSGEELALDPGIDVASPGKFQFLKTV